MVNDGPSMVNDEWWWLMMNDDFLDIKLGNWKKWHHRKSGKMHQYAPVLFPFSVEIHESHEHIVTNESKEKDRMFPLNLLQARMLEEYRYQEQICCLYIVFLFFRCSLASRSSRLPGSSISLNSKSYSNPDLSNPSCVSGCVGVSPPLHRTLGELPGAECQWGCLETAPAVQVGSDPRHWGAGGAVSHPSQT